MAVAEATTFVVHDPATGEEIARVADADRSAIEAAIAAAHAAFPSWSALPSESRAELLHRAHHLLVERTEPIARLLTRENGKPLSESRAEVSMSARFLLWHAEEAKRTYGRVVPPSVKDRRILVLRQPVGVVAAITPWNFPLSMVARKVAPAIAAGCTVILRPAKKTPLVAIELFDIFAAAGFPPGVANLVTSRDAALFAEMALADRRVRKITFTGSTEVGKSLLAGASSQVKRVSLELGGHAPFIVFEDADLDAAAAAAVLSRFRNAGQTCVCTNRLLVQRSIVREFTERVASRVAALRVGNGLDDGTDVGPLIDRSALAKVEAHQGDAIARGARVLVGGQRLTSLPGGLFYQPTLLDRVGPDALVAREETFGPLLPIIEFTDESEALRIANDTPYGLAAYFHTRDLARMFRIAEGLEYGIVGVNDPIPVGPHIPFGGMKESGLGREAGTEGIDEFLETKAVSIGI
ncbi:MAG: NAD-dependent succinate-semialdehyde dehydrogenase [Chloroflexi bacterium]|nr:MAG: NAD-dependent succinate-semialdehyde dehydrogenase [Chloroflexota bacterium]